MSLLIFKRTWVTILLVICFTTATICWAEPADKPFLPGEKLTFQLKWGLIPAGEALLEILPIEKLDDQPVYHFVMTVRTNSFLDLFYYYRSRIDAYADFNMTRSVRYREQTQTRHMATDVVVDFDRQAHFKRTETVFKSKPEASKKERTTPLLPGTFDPLSVYYFTRVLDLKEGDQIERPISDGLKCVVAHAEVIRRESLTINGKTYDTFLLKPDFKGVKPVFEKLTGATILVWISADDRRIPVKLASRIVLGHFIGELISIEGVRDISTPFATTKIKERDSQK